MDQMSLKATRSRYEKRGDSTSDSTSNTGGIWWVRFWQRGITSIQGWLCHPPAALLLEWKIEKGGTSDFFDSAAVRLTFPETGCRVWLRHRAKPLS